MSLLNRDKRKTSSLKLSQDFRDRIVASLWWRLENSGNSPIIYPPTPLKEQQNSSRCVLVNCTCCLDRLLLKYYNFEIFSTTYWKFLSTRIHKPPNTHTRVYNCCFSSHCKGNNTLDFPCHQKIFVRTLPIRLFRNMKIM